MTTFERKVFRDRLKRAHLWTPVGSHPAFIQFTADRQVWLGTTCVECGDEIRMLVPLEEVHGYPLDGWRCGRCSL